ncbi:STM4015 family protein [Streptomyces sp. NPDC057301]|uniref:STM4015 family protein n=1 Tax=Streptomyces sp. NPDC057301 TaxID=3346093 RepID=UPI00362DB377
MPIYDHLQALYGLPAYDFPGSDARTDDLPEPGSFAWRITSYPYQGGEDDGAWTHALYQGGEDDDADWTHALAHFCATVDTTRVRALIAGAWHEPEDGGLETDSSAVIEPLVAARDRFPALKALFLGDMVLEQSEMSWINLTDVTPLLAAFPDLEEFGVRGGRGLRFPALRHTALRKLTMESAGLPAEVVRGVGASDLPALEHLDLWLGDPHQGGDSQVTDLEAILSGVRLPRLRHLALRNSQMQDAVAAAVASAPVVARLKVLDLSMGVLTDEGAAALLAGRPLTHLEHLDLHHHYISEPLQNRLRHALEPAGVLLNLDRDDAYEMHNSDGRVWRYVAVGE